MNNHLRFPCIQNADLNEIAGVVRAEQQVDRFILRIGSVREVITQCMTCGFF